LEAFVISILLFPILSDCLKFYSDYFCLITDFSVNRDYTQVPIRHQHHKLSYFVSVLYFDFWFFLFRIFNSYCGGVCAWQTW